MTAVITHATFPRGAAKGRAWVAWASRVLLSIPAIVGLFSLSSAREALPFECGSTVDSLLAPLVAAKEFSGAVVLTREGVPVYSRGFGLANHEVGLPFTPETPADGASLAKTLTAAGFWSLVEEGRIELDAPVTRYVEEYPHSTSVRHLIAHTNGLPPYYEFFDPYFGSDEVRTTPALLQRVAEHASAPSFEPGTRFEYSNLGFDAAALVIERVTGQGYEEFLRARFFQPLGMDATFARPARLADWDGVRTVGHRWSEGAWQLVEVFDLEAFLGASNLYFSASDLARWGSANAMGTALPAAVFERGQERPSIAGHPSPITGLSWYTDESGSRGYYTGSINAFQSLVYWDRERGEAIAVLTNSSVPPWTWITLQRDLVDVLAEREVRAEPPFDPASFERATRAAVAGSYAIEGIGMVHVRADSQRVALRVDDGLEFDAFPVSRDVFYVPGPDYFVRFGGGEPAVMQVRSVFVEGIGARVE